MNQKILLTEDDAFLREGLCELLTKEGYDVTAVKGAKETEERLQNGRFALVILDIMLPDGNGLTLLRALRRENRDVPVLLLTALDDESEIVKGLDAGADDYVTKPFGVRELLSRVRALLRRGGAEPRQFGGLYIDLEKMTVRKDGEPVLLTPTEFQILALLVRDPGAVITRNRLLSVIWDCDENFIDDNTLSVHISRLREKIGSENLRTVRGVGYKWEPTP